MQLSEKQQVEDNKDLSTTGTELTAENQIVGENNQLTAQTSVQLSVSATDPAPVVQSQPQAIPQPKAETQVIPQVESLPATNTYFVTAVVDGDTIKLDNGATVRYIGIDTPETVHPSKPVECFGKEASNKNKELVLNKQVRLEKDVSDTDRYDRWLRYVYVGDTFVNDYLVRQGYATAYTYPPDVKYSSQFQEAEQEARRNNRGSWGGCEDNSDKNTQDTITEPVTTPPVANETQTGAHIFYLSTYRTAEYYYCDTDDGWKGLSENWLESYPSESALLSAHPGKILHEPCK